MLNIYTYINLRDLFKDMLKFQLANSKYRIVNQFLLRSYTCIFERKSLVCNSDMRLNQMNLSYVDILYQIPIEKFMRSQYGDIVNMEIFTGCEPYMEA